ncbi:MAG: hypothetical protein OHK0052_02340 [Anaerolineales bacterium]
MIVTILFLIAPSASTGAQPAARSLQLPLWQVPIAVLWQPDGKQIAVSASESIFILASDTLSITARLPSGVFSAALVNLPDGKFASGGNDGVLRTWDWQTGALLHTQPAHTKSISALAVQTGSGVLASGGRDAFIHVWQPQNRRDLLGSSWVLTALAFSHDGSLFYSVEGALIRVRNTEDWRLVRVLTAEGGIAAFAAAPNGQIAAATAQGIALWEQDGSPQSGKLLPPSGAVGGANSPMACLAFSPDSVSLAGGSPTGRVYLWDSSNPTGVALPQSHASAVSALAFSPDGRWLLSVSYDGLLILHPLP